MKQKNELAAHRPFIISASDRSICVSVFSWNFSNWKWKTNSVDSGEWKEKKEEAENAAKPTFWAEISLLRQSIYLCTICLCRIAKGNIWLLLMLFFILTIPVIDVIFREEKHIELLYVIDHSINTPIRYYSPIMPCDRTLYHIQNLLELLAFFLSCHTFIFSIHFANKAVGLVTLFVLFVPFFTFCILLKRYCIFIGGLCYESK